MASSWQSVSRGLRLILTGAKVIGWSLLATVGALVVGFCVLMRTQGNMVGGVVLTLLFAALGSVGIGRLLCTVGRFLCLRTPTDAPAARAAIRLAVILETCGLLTWASAFAIIFTPFAGPEMVFSGYAFALLCNVSGRVFFFRYLYLVGQQVQSRSLSDEATRFIRFSISGMVSAILGTGLLVVGNMSQTEDPSVRAVQVLACVGGVISLSASAGFLIYLFITYFFLIAEAQRTMVNYTPPPADDDPDREYRDRYFAGGSTETDADT